MCSVKPKISGKVLGDVNCFDLLSMMYLKPSAFLELQNMTPEELQKSKFVVLMLYLKALLALIFMQNY